MERKKILEQTADIDAELALLRGMLKTIEATDFTAHPSVYESLTVAAAMKAEKTACNLRHLIYAATNVTKRELMKKVADVHGIDINYEDEIFTVMLPVLLQKKKRGQSSEFISDPLHFALEEFFEANSIEIFVECAVVFEHIYDGNRPGRRVCDYDNLELKPILDTVSAFVMTDDSGKFCDVFHTTGYADSDRTKISVMAKNKFWEWVSKRI